LQHIFAAHQLRLVFCLSVNHAKPFKGRATGEGLALFRISAITFR
jgi:hypothetical protein